jgi:predicted ATPase
MPETVPRFYVITGGPGSGKTTLIDELRRLGYATSLEAGRAIIQDQQQIGGDAVPWRDARAFAELMLSWELRSYRTALATDEPVFFDRGIPDVIGYLRLIGLALPEHFANAARLFRYQPCVFIAPPWPEIFTADAERRQTFDEAVRTYEAMVRTYSSYGYILIELPRTSPAGRLQFVLERLGGAEAIGPDRAPGYRA